MSAIRRETSRYRCHREPSGRRVRRRRRPRHGGGRGARRARAAAGAVLPVALLRGGRPEHAAHERAGRRDHTRSSDACRTVVGSRPRTPASRRHATERGLRGRSARPHPVARRGGRWGHTGRRRGGHVPRTRRAHHQRCWLRRSTMRWPWRNDPISQARPRPPTGRTALPSPSTTSSATRASNGSLSCSGGEPSCSGAEGCHHLECTVGPMQLRVRRERARQTRRGVIVAEHRGRERLDTMLDRQARPGGATTATPPRGAATRPRRPPQPLPGWAGPRAGRIAPHRSPRRRTPPPAHPGGRGPRMRDDGARSDRAPSRARRTVGTPCPATASRTSERGGRRRRDGWVAP